MSACGTGVGNRWQNDFESGLLQKLLFPTHVARPVIQWGGMWSHVEGGGTDDW